MTSITITIGIPSNKLNPNNAPMTRGGQRGLHRLRKEQKESAWKCALAALNGREAPRWPTATVHVRLYEPNRRALGKRDQDNLIASLKGAIDGIAGAGIVLNDNGVRWGVFDLCNIDSEFPRIELTFIPEGVQ